jgi:hypothetical protein
MTDAEKAEIQAKMDAAAEKALEDLKALIAVPGNAQGLAAAAKWIKDNKNQAGYNRLGKKLITIA